MKNANLKRLLTLVLITVLAVLALSLTSCDGQAGSAWLSGDSAPTADVGKVGDFYLETDSFDVWEYKADGWALIANIKGEVGAAGADGKDGAKGEVGDTGDDGAADDNNIHPNAAGMELISNCFLKVLEEKYVDYAK